MFTGLRKSSWSILYKSAFSGPHYYECNQLKSSLSVSQREEYIPVSSLPAER